MPMAAWHWNEIPIAPCLYTLLWNEVVFDAGMTSGTYVDDADSTKKSIIQAMAPKITFAGDFEDHSGSAFAGYGDSPSTFSPNIATLIHGAAGTLIVQPNITTKNHHQVTGINFRPTETQGTKGYDWFHKYNSNLWGRNITIRRNA